MGGWLLDVVSGCVGGLDVVRGLVDGLDGHFFVVRGGLVFARKHHHFITEKGNFLRLEKCGIMGPCPKGKMDLLCCFLMGLLQKNLNTERRYLRLC